MEQTPKQPTSFVRVGLLRSSVILCWEGHPTEHEGFHSGQVLWFGQIGTGMSSLWPWRGASLSCETMAFRCLLLPSHLRDLSLWLSHFCHPLNTIGKDSSSLMLLTVALSLFGFHPQSLLLFRWLSGPLFEGLPLLKKVLCTPILW